jgi:hypothetical protein
VDDVVGAVVRKTYTQQVCQSSIQSHRRYPISSLPNPISCRFEIRALFFVRLSLRTSTSHDPARHYMAYFLVHSLASSSYLAGSVLKICAISGTSGSSGFGSVRREQMESSTFDILIVKINVSLVWAISRGNVVNGK